MKNLKKQIIMIVMTTALCLCASFPVFAQDNTSNGILVSQHTEHYVDGTYAVVSVYQSVGPRSSINGTKDYKYYDSGLAWTLTVYGSFSYNGSSVVCTNVSSAYTTPGAGWRCLETHTSSSGNSATANGTFAKSGGSTANSSVTLYCSPNGTLS